MHNEEQRSTHQTSIGRVLALDVGQRRIGVAMSDPHGILAAPLTTLKAVPHTRVLHQIIELVQEHAVDKVVIGLPLTMRGDIGPQAQVIQEFATALEQAMKQAQERTRQSPVPVLLFDERLTSVVAEQMMRDLGIRPEKRKERIDEVAASIILQDYLDSQTSLAWHSTEQSHSHSEMGTEREE